MSWIKVIPFDRAEGTLRTAYKRVTGPDGHIDNILALHSLRPHTLDGHMRLYKNVLHHKGNNLPKWWLETLGTYASMLNRCEYCVEHHFEGLRRLLDDDNRAALIRKALEGRTVVASISADQVAGSPDNPFSVQETAALEYVQSLTLTPWEMTEEDVNKMRNSGYSDGEILEINQVTAYFAYANRTVLGLGCTTDGDVLGLSPGESDDPNNWSHG
ncbi:MAG: alkylhydroperoxidase [Bacteroidetes bacterium]|nr:MAG: alkylhydroperoxidase [Bacteroidota bacterium]